LLAALAYLKARIHRMSDRCVDNSSIWIDTVCIGVVIPTPIGNPKRCHLFALQELETALLA
jgi:hypothetical protein